MMKRFLLSVIGVALVGAAIPTYAAGRGVVIVGGRGGFGYGYGYGGFYGPYGDGFYPYGYGLGVPNAGTVKLDTPLKTANVFINGNFAGTVKQLKTMTMLSGKYTIEVRAEGWTSYQQAIYVTPGKTLTLHPDNKML